MNIFRNLLSDELKEKTGIDLAEDLGAFTYARTGFAAPGIAAARVVDSLPSFFLAMISTTPPICGKDDACSRYTTRSDWAQLLTL